MTEQAQAPEDKRQEQRPAVVRQQQALVAPIVRTAWVDPAGLGEAVLVR